jgi:3-deoxy-manno-octulosonate cytidylyltransferase (CMP-KDO synthetase)
MKVLGVIPSRYASTRFPAKSLADIEGKSIVQRVYEQAVKSTFLHKVIVATDHKKIYEHVRSFGGMVCMTSESHQSGTDRAYEVLSKEAELYDYVINIQGDEPFIAPEQIDLLTKALDGHTEIATLAKRIKKEETLFNSNIVKVVFNQNSDALYFSREAIPHLRGIEKKEWTNSFHFFKHIGIYAYRTDILRDITVLQPSPLEKAEALEQLRWLDNGYIIKVIETEFESLGIDTPEDLEKAKEYLKSKTER